MIILANAENVEKWNELIASGPAGGNLLQGREFLEQKADAGWKPRYVMIGDRAIGVLEKNIPLLGKLWYCPLGPCTTSVNDLGQVLAELKPFAKKHSVFTIKVEPLLDHTVDMQPLNLLKTKPVQYNVNTVLVDLSPSLENIMKSLNQKGRHAIRRAERDGVTVKRAEPTEENCQIMYKLLKQTGEGAGFPIRPFDYYKTFYQRYGENGGLFFAYFDGQPVAGAFAMVQGTKSMYKDGASVRERPAYGASHLLQWHVIQWVKSKGSVTHDLAGAPPIAFMHDKTHTFYNIGRFKRQFNNEITEYVGAYDVPVVDWKAKIWHKFAEKVVRKLFFMRKKQSWY